MTGYSTASATQGARKRPPHPAAGAKSAAESWTRAGGALILQRSARLIRLTSRKPAIWSSVDRAVYPECCSGDVRHRVIGRGQGLALRQGRVRTGRCDGIGLRLPLVEMPKYAFDEIDLVDERADARLLPHLSGSTS